MSELSGKRLVGNREAPILNIWYECNDCGAVRLLDAYKGPPSCACKGNFMQPHPGGVPTDG